MTKMKNMSKRKKKEERAAYLFLLPVLIGTITFLFIPMIMSFGYSLTNWKGMGDAAFVGLKNFVKLFTEDEKFLAEMRNTLVFVIGSVPAMIILGLLFACLLNAGIKAKGFFRVIYFLPNVMMGAAVAMLWKWLLNSRFGVIDAVLNALFGIRPAWLTDTRLTMISMCFIAVWAGTGYCIVIFLSALQDISQSYYEAAVIDGAGVFQKFRYITLPLITPSIFFLMVTRIIAAFNNFDYVFMLAGDEGPVQESLRTIVFGIYRTGFQEYQMGYASAKAVILFFVIMAVTYLQFMGEKKWVNY